MERRIQRPRLGYVRRPDGREDRVDASLIDSDVIHGRDAVVSFLRRVEKELWSAIRYEIIEATDLSEDGVVLRVNVAARGRGSGAKIHGERWEAMRVRDGCITQYAYRATRDEALEAAGLQE